MAKAYLTESPQWAKHLRDWKKLFWNQEKQTAKKDLTKQIEDDTLIKY